LKNKEGTDLTVSRTLIMTQKPFDEQQRSKPPDYWLTLNLMSVFNSKSQRPLKILVSSTIKISTGKETSMAQKRLDEYTELATKKVEHKKENETLAVTPARGKSEDKNHFAPINLPPSYFVSATYDGHAGKALLKLYEPATGKIYFWLDNTGHKPYCLCNLPPYELGRLERLMKHPSFNRFEIEEKYDTLQDKTITVTKIVANDPLAIGGRPQGSIREIIPEDYPNIASTSRESVKVWEARIKYYQSYIYDRQLLPGMIYEVRNGSLAPAIVYDSEKTVEEILQRFPEATAEEKEYIEQWARLLEYPAPRFRRAAIDIEVYASVASRVPDPREAAYPVIAAAVYGSDGKKTVMLLKREDTREGNAHLPVDVQLEYYESEEQLLRALFNVLDDYPFIITFNGDDFDLRYLAHRALNLGIGRVDVPVEVGRRVCLLRYGIHIDLYKFFFNRSIQIYAFNNRYRDVTLDDVATALIAAQKIRLEKSFGELSYTELAEYCFRDAEITFKLTSFEDELTMKLILVLSRISSMPMEDVSRQGVSRWIRNFMHREHRKRNMLIPNAEDILATKGKTATKATIKGKKYQGAIVVEPTPGVHFNVAVMDFPSLYPSIIKVWNLGYQTVLCPHEECRTNLVPGTPHWVCTRKRALESLLIGSLRDLRVSWYKLKSKDKSLPAEKRSWYNIIQGALKVILNASVAYEEPVVLRDALGQIHFVAIGEFVDDIIAHMPTFTNGAHTVAPVTGWEALCFNPANAKISFARVTHVIRHENMGRKLIELTLKSGRKVKVTPEHSVFTLKHDTGRIEPVETVDLEKGDCIAVPVKAEKLEDENQTLNLMEALFRQATKEQCDLVVYAYKAFETGQTATKTLKSTPATNTVQHFWKTLGKNRRVSFEKSTTYTERKNKDTQVSLRIGTFRENSYMVPAFMKVDAKLARLMGYYAAAGCAQKRVNKQGATDCSIRIECHSMEALSDVENCLRETFGLPHRHWKKGMELNVNSEILYLLFKALLGDKNENKKMPSVIFTAPETIKKAFLEAYSTLSGRRDGKSYELTSKSAILANQLVYLLIQLGIDVEKLGKVNGMHSLSGRGLQRSPIDTNSCTVPTSHPAHAKTLASCTVYLDEEADSTRATLLSKEKEYECELQSFTPTAIGDIGLDQITDIHLVNSGSQYVYDLSVEGAENFIGGYGLVCLHNSYGVFGAETFDLYCPPVAEATAAIGRHSITQILSKAKTLEIQVLYGDTDSVFLKNPSPEQIETLARWTERELKMSIDVDKVYRYAVFSSRKKNYLGVLEDGSVDVKGLTGKKKHIPAFIKEAFNKMKERLAMVKNPADFEKAKRDIAEIVRERYMRLKRREWDNMNDLAFHVVLGEEIERYTKTTPQHVKAAKILKENGVELRAGDLISFVKVTREPRVKPVQLATKNEVDVDKYIAYLHSTFDQVLDALGLSFDEIIGLTKLERFLV